MKNQSLIRGIFENKYLLGAFLLGSLMQVIVVIFEPIATIFKLVPLTQTQWIYTIAISFMPLVIIEVQKKFNEFKFGRVIYKKEEKLKQS